MVQGAIHEVNPAGVTFFDVSSSPYSHYVVNNALAVNDDYLPESEGVETEASGNVFTDTYKSIKSWTQQKLAPLNFASNVLMQPYGFLLDIGLPVSVAVAFGVLWYMVGLIIIVSWWMGR